MLAFADVTPTACHLHPCQSPTKAYCSEPATDVALLLDPGVNVEPLELDLCEWCLTDLTHGGIVEPQRPIA